MFFLINTTIILFPVFIISGFYIHFISQLHTSPCKHVHCPTPAHIAPHISDSRDPLPIAAHDFVFKASDDCNYASINVIRPTEREADCNSSRKKQLCFIFCDLQCFQYCNRVAIHAFGGRIAAFEDIVGNIGIFRKKARRMLAAKREHSRASCAYCLPAIAQPRRRIADGGRAVRNSRSPPYPPKQQQRSQPIARKLGADDLNADRKADF